MNPNTSVNVRWPVLVVAAAAADWRRVPAPRTSLLRQSGAFRCAEGGARYRPPTPPAGDALLECRVDTAVRRCVAGCRRHAQSGCRRARRHHRRDRRHRRCDGGSAAAWRRRAKRLSPGGGDTPGAAGLPACSWSWVSAFGGARRWRRSSVQSWPRHITRYTSVSAELEAHERELARTEKLVEIGAASRQELERLHAEHTARRADVQSARSRLELLGVPAAALDVPARTTKMRASADVPAPIDGVVTERLANVGLNVDPASKLFTVVDLTTVWVVAELYEKDFSRVRVGSPATVTTTAYPDLALQGRVSYIDPQVSAQTRTAKLRVEVRNPAEPASARDVRRCAGQWCRRRGGCR